MTICLSNSTKLPQTFGEIIDDIYVASMTDALQLIRELSEAVQGFPGGSVIFREEGKLKEEFEGEVFADPDLPRGGL